MSKKRKIIISIVILFSLATSGVFALQGFFGGGGDIPEDTMTRGLVGYWSFDEGGGSIARDASGNNNHGTLTNGPKWTQGKNGGALKFDGKNDYVNCGNGSSLDITDEITIEAWIMPDANKRADIVSRYYYSGATDNGGYSLRFWNDGKFYFVTLNDSQGGISANGVAGKWNHVIATYDVGGGANNLKIYVNGLLAGQTTKANALKSIVQNLKIGNSSYYYDGQIDEVRIYNRALSEEEVRYHYNHGGPVGYWDMDEGSGSTINDKSGNGNDGTLVNGPTWTQGKYGSALSFDGVDDYVNCGNRNALAPTRAITLTAWIKPNGPGGNNYGRIFRKEGTDYEIYMSNGPQIYAMITDSGGNAHGLSSDSNTVPYGQWSHVTVTYDGTVQKIFINGVQQSITVSWAASIKSSGSSLFIGNISGVSRTFDGLIDEAKVYNYARTEEEIRLDYNAGMATHLGPSGKTCSEDPASCMDYGLVGNWDMDEGGGSMINDNSGNNNHGTLTNGPKWTQGKNGGALQFDGKDDYARVSHNSSLDIVADITIEAWIKKNNPNIRNDIVYKDLGGYNFMTHYINKALFFQAQDSGGVWRAVYSNSNAIVDNNWHHVVVTYSRPDVVFYVDGKYWGTASRDYDIKSTSGDIIIGSMMSINYNYFNGAIDEVKIYNRALSEAEVRYHYNHGGPVAHWDMDEGSGLKINDKSGNGNDGTISGATWTQGKYGSALSFDGVDDYASVANSASLNPTSKITVGLWAKRNGAGTGVTPGLLSKRANGFGLIWQVGADTERLSTRLYQSDGTEINSNVIEGVLSVGVWRYITLVADGTNVITYVDGVPKKSVPYNGTILTGTASLTIGQQSSAYFNGLIDDVRIYNYARTEEEIRLDYNAGMATHLGPSGKTCSEDPASCMDYGLAGNWDMDEGSGSVINDNSGNNNHGTLTNGPKWTQGKNGSALQFDGKDDYVDVENNAILNFGTNDFSIETWFKSQTGHDGTSRFLIAKYCNGYTQNYSLVQTNGNKLRFGIANGTISIVAEASDDYNDNKWHHALAIRNSDSIYLYVDGKLVGSNTGVSSFNVDNIYNFSIGNRYCAPRYPFFGQIDEVRIYNRALSAEEVRYHYNQGGPVAHWDMDEGEGTRAFDSSGNNNHGAISGATWVEGKYGSALSFDGVDDYVNCGTSSSLNIADSMTASAWIYPKTLGEGSAGHIVGRGGTAGWCFYVYTSNSLKLLSGAGIQVTSEANSITLNQWQYVTVVYDKQNVRFFVNGVEKGVTAETDSILNTGSCVIGARSTAGDFDFNGYLDDVRVYNYARTAEQIRMDYQQGVATHLK